MPGMVPGPTLGLMGRPRAGFAALFVALVVTAAACSGGGSSAKTTATTSSVAANDPAGCRFIVASPAARKIPSSVTLPEYLVGASAAPTICYDKITFLFSQGANPAALPPGYQVEYKQPPFAPKLQSTTETLTGVRAILEVTIAPASLTDATTNPSRPTHTYQGNLRLALPGLRHTLIVELLSTFPQSPDPNAGTVVWLIGLDSKRPFVTDAAANPPRVNVLIMN
jgi:hypothetical protein